MSHCVYILTNQAGTVLYTGVTDDLPRRIWEYKQKVVPGFTSRYNVTRLVYYEPVEDRDAALMREKQIKGGSRAKKLALIAGLNPEWRDLYQDLE